MKIIGALLIFVIVGVCFPASASLLEFERGSIYSYYENSRYLLVVQHVYEETKYIHEPKTAKAVMDLVQRQVNNLRAALKSLHYTYIPFDRRQAMPEEFRPDFQLKLGYQVEADDLCCQIYKINYWENGIRAVVVGDFYMYEFDNEKEFLQAILKSIKEAS